LSVSNVSIRWFSARAVRLHATAFLVVAACLILGWWQLERALSGNTLSWAYTIEWPFFGGYAIFMWWKLLHEDPAGRPLRARAGLRPAKLNRSKPDHSSENQAEEGEKLAEYNRYLEELNASDRSPRRS
jgi:hypothetical protein